MKSFLVTLSVVSMCACQQTGSAPKLQSHLAAAKTNSQQTATHIAGTKSHLETADFKGSKATELLNKGVYRP